VTALDPQNTGGFEAGSFAVGAAFSNSASNFLKSSRSRRGSSCLSAFSLSASLNPPFKAFRSSSTDRCA